MLSYTFWHWRQPAVPATDYETRQRAFHAALAAAPLPQILEGKLPTP